MLQAINNTNNQCVANKIFIHSQHTARCCEPDTLCLLQKQSCTVQNTSTLHFGRTYRGLTWWKWSIPCNKVNTRAIVYCRQLFCCGMCKCLYRFKYREQNYKKTNRLSNLILSKWLSGTPSESWRQSAKCFPIPRCIFDSSGAYLRVFRQRLKIVPRIGHQIWQQKYLVTLFSSSNQLQLLDSYYIQPRGDDFDDLHKSDSSKIVPRSDHQI